MVGYSSIVHNLERSAQRWPKGVAVREADSETSFERLWQLSRGVAAYLKQAGLQPGDRVAIVLGNSSQYVATYYGILAAGGIAVALNTAAKARDFTTWLQHSGARWLFAMSGNNEVSAAAASLTDITRIDVDAAEGLWSSAADDLQFADLVADRPAAMLYTSGTTGNPKGVLLSHGNLASNTAAIVEYLGLTERDSIVNVLPFYYSYGNSVLHSHLSAGARITLADNLVYPHLVVEALASHKATGFAGVPSTYLLMLSRGRLPQYDLSSLRYLTQAGGAMPPSVVRKVREALPNARLVVMYGQTEATARLTWLPPEQLENKLGSVGVAIPGVVVCVLREDGSEAAIGEIGEVCARGPNVMLGYWNNPQATAVALRDGWLHTGDMGRLDVDGHLFLLGRRSDMIKTGAHRVHPQDIEAVIMEIPGVAEAAIVAMDDDVLGEAVRAIVVPSEGASLDAMQIQVYCRARLANYKVPKVVDFRASLPRTTSGKIIRHILSERNQSQ
jgi:acyl-CoA synthetase (AMP-forming)/AMP-acid ligase II